MQVHGFNANGSIDATLNGIRMTIPDDMANRDRQMIHDEWEYDKPDPQTGERVRINTIPPYVAPTPRPVGEIDQETLNAALAAEGSVVRALALVLLQEINTIRTKLPVPLPVYTPQQLVAALKAKMR
jgi:hypothetical protein